MLYISVEDFMQKVSGLSKLSRPEEKALALKMRQGDSAARQAIIDSYLPMVAGFVRRMPESVRTLNAVYRCVASLEKGVDSFNFLQDGESFTHHLSWRMRQCLTACIADRGDC